MPDDDIQPLDIRLFERLHQGRELDLAADLQPAPAKCDVATAGKNPITIDLAVFRVFKSAA
jgi:hypothetical protein